MNKKIIVFTLSFLVANAIAVSSIYLASANLKVDSAPYLYTLDLNKDNQITKFENSTPNKSKNTDTGFVKTSLGNEIKLTYTMESDIAPYDSFIEMGYEDYFEFDVPLNGLAKMEYRTNQNMKIEAGYTKDNYIFSDTVGSTGFNTRVFSFSDMASAYGVSPCYLKLTSGVSESSENRLVIKHLKLYYTCDVSPDPTEEVGIWSYEDNTDVASSITITGFSIDQDKIPANKGLYIPQEIDGKTVTRINEGVLNNVPWLERITIPFVGECRYMDREGFSYNFASIFGKNDAHNKYRPFQQYEGDKINVWYIPKSLTSISVTRGNQDKDGSIYRYYLPSYSFYGCDNNITEVNLDGRIDEICPFAFTNSATLDEVILPSSVESVGAGTFNGCNSLSIICLSTKLTISDEANPQYRPVSYGYQGTIVTEGLIFDICTTYTNDTYLNVVGLESNTTILNIPALVSYEHEYYQVKRIANRAFENEYNLKAISISEEIEMVGHYAFLNCYKASAYLKSDPAELPQKYLSDWDKGLGGVYTGLAFYSDSTDYVYYKTSDSYYIVDMKGNYGQQLIVDLSSYEDLNVVFPHHAFDGDVRIFKVIIPKNTIFKPYSFANCIHLERVEYEGTMDEFNALKKAGHLGYNSFLNTSIIQVKCYDGWVSID